MALKDKVITLLLLVNTQHVPELFQLYKRGVCFTIGIAKTDADQLPSRSFEIADSHQMLLHCRH